MSEKSSYKTGISLPETMHTRAVERAQSVAGGKFARYVQHLIQADLESTPAPTSYDDCIVAKLATTYAGHIGPKLASNLASAGVDQPQVIHDLLIQMQEAFAAGAKPVDMVLVPRWTLNPSHAWHRPMLRANEKVATSQKSGSTLSKSLFIQKETADPTLNESAPKPPHKAETSETEHAWAALRAGRHSKATPTPPQPTPAGAA